MPVLAQTPTASDNSRGFIKRALLTGAAIVVPVVLTIYVTILVFNFLSQFLAPGVFLAQDTLGFDDVPVGAIQAVTALASLAVVFLIGAIAEHRAGSGSIEERFDALVAGLPGIGSIYSSLNEISELLLSQDTQSFKEVKVVEFPQEGSYMLGFVTADHPRVMEQSTGHREMTTVFAPMGPNPFMGGFVLHLPEERVYEIDMSVEEGIQTIVSSGVVVNDRSDARADAGEQS
jgi:uncharacterized membrane protein